MDDIVCDIVLLSWNSPDVLSACLEGLFANTDRPSRLIIVDNASEPAVRAFLRTMTPRGCIREVTLVQNDSNEGFPRGMNRGMRLSSARYVCLLNNDTVPAPAWLSRLLDVAEAHKEIGILNPGSNTFGDAQPGRATRGRVIEVGSCIGFCFLIKRDVMDQIGLLNETFGPFFYEDEDYCLRAKAAGFRCVIVPSAYVFHQEHHSIKRLPQREAIFRESRQRFMKQWGRRLRLVYGVSQPLNVGTPALREHLERAMGWARRGAFVRVVFAGNTREWAHAFESVGLSPPHMDVSLYPYGRLELPVRLLIMVLTRCKKRFDLIIVDRPGLARIVRACSVIHRADVILDSEPERLERLWQRKARSPS